MRRLRRTVAVLAIMALALPATAGTREKAPMWEFGTTVETGGFASLARNADSIEINVHLRDLNAGHAITVWVVHWTDPGVCAGACGEDDLGKDGNGAIWSKIGGVVNPAGNFDAKSTLAEGEDTGGPIPLALADAERAEIHLVVQDHGLALTGADLDVQTSTFRGECNVVCFDPQAAVFK